MQVRELEAQLETERRPGTPQADRCSSDSGAAGEWRRKHDALLSRHQQLQQQLVAVRDIHGIEMPLLAGDAAVAAADDAAPTAAAVQATLASVQARQDEAERRMREVLQRREAAERQRSLEWQRRVDALNAQVWGPLALAPCRRCCRLSVLLPSLLRSLLRWRMDACECACGLLACMDG